MLKILRNQDGMAIFVAVMMMVMLTMIGIAAIKLSNDEVTIAGNEMNETIAFYAAEAGLEQAAAALQASYMTTGGPPTTMPSGSQIMNDCAAAYTTSQNGGVELRTLTKGTLAGLNAQVQSYEIRSTALSMVDRSQITLTEMFECALVPLFQFAVFYGNDLEIAPGPDMTLIGRVHSNGNLWLQAGNTLYMDSYVTCSGNLRHGRKGAGGVSTGDVMIKDTDGNYQNMKNGDGSFLTSSSSNWYDSAYARWGGRVQDAAFGQEELHMPLTAEGDPHKIIERAASNPDSYEHKAALRIIDGVAEAKMGGVWVDVSGLLPAGTITNTSFTDLREGKTVNSTDVDISKLKTSPYFPPNGVLYMSDSRTSFDGSRLTNASDLGSGLTVVSENPLYVQGDYNTVNKKPAALMGDAITFLSNSWDDSKSSQGIDNRIASNTTVNASIMTGNTNTTSSNYNGGLENLPRFLENWSGRDFVFKGSLVNLWNSQQAVGPWSYGSYYKAPNRIWSYDTDLDNPANHPPETPTVQVFQRTGWKQESLEYSSAASD
ncbi:MAG TPA: hypothetical protein ENL22_00815 [candidate division Zixibacteria bacterium]|nr:hypothetical protein [candidate division Zixibacteria bacterium]